MPCRHVAKSPEGHCAPKLPRHFEESRSGRQPALTNEHWHASARHRTPDVDAALPREFVSRQVPGGIVAVRAFAFFAEVAAATGHGTRFSGLGLLSGVRWEIIRPIHSTWVRTSKARAASSGRQINRSGRYGSGWLYRSGLPSRRVAWSPAASATATGAHESHSNWPPVCA